MKEIAFIAGINMCISFHVSRHTFVIRFLERCGKIEVVKEILSHSAIETTMEYVHELNQQAKKSDDVYRQLIIWKKMMIVNH